MKYHASSHRTLLTVLVGIFTLVGGAIPSVSAHDELEITVDAKRTDEFIVVELVQARGTMLAGCSKETGGKKVFHPNRFDSVKEAFEQCGAASFKVLTSEGDLLEPISATAYLTRESHVAVRLVFEAAQTDAVLEANFFDRFPSYEVHATVQLWNGRKFVERRILSKGERSMEIPIFVEG